MKNSRSAVSLATALLLAACAGIANASSIQASFYTPYLHGPVVIIDLGGIIAPDQTDILGTGYSVSFAVGPNQGVVTGFTQGLHAVPVAGVSSSGPQYLTGGFGSPLTTEIGASGNYFSTGTGAITMAFTTEQTWLALLWGSIDTGNTLTFSSGGEEFPFIVTGAEVQAATEGFVSDGYQRWGGSAYVVINPDRAFTSVTASSGVVSFEFAGVAASRDPFTVVPEPSTFGCLFGIGIAVVAMRRRLHFR